MNTSPDVEAQIAQVEQRLVAREARLRQGVHEARRQVDEAMRPPNWLAPAAGVVAALLVWRRVRRRHRPIAVAAPRSHGLGLVGSMASLLAAAAPVLLRVVDRHMASKDAARESRAEVGRRQTTPYGRNR